MDATTSGERIEVGWQCRNQRLAFASAHLRNLSLMQDDATNQLHIEVAHAGGADAGFPDDGKCLRQNFVQGCSLESFALFLVLCTGHGLLQLFFENGGARAQFIVGKLLY